MCFTTPKGPPNRPKLSRLATEFLGRTIQKGDGTTGHSPEEDALAALDLAEAKAERGPFYGCKDAKSKKESLLTVLGEHGRRCCLVAGREDCRKHCEGATSAVVAGDAEAEAALAAGGSGAPEAAANRAVAAMARHQAQAGWHCLTAVLDAACGAPPPPSGAAAVSSAIATGGGAAAASGAAAPAAAAAASPEAQAAQLRAVDKEVAAIYDACKPNTMLMVVAQPSLTWVEAMKRQRNAAMDARTASTWTQTQEVQFNALKLQPQKAGLFFRLRR